MENNSQETNHPLTEVRDTSFGTTQIPAMTPAPNPTPEPKSESGSWTLVITISIILIFILGGVLFYFIPKLTTPKTQSNEKPTPTVTTITTTPVPSATTPSSTKNKKYVNDFIGFTYPDTAKQVTSGRDVTFNLAEDGSSTGNYILYTMSTLGSNTLETWIAKNEKCGTPKSRIGKTFTNTTGVTGIEIKNLGACPTGASSVIDSFYFTTGKTVHVFRLHQGGVKEVSPIEQSTFTSLLNSITLSLDTTGNK